MDKIEKSIESLLQSLHDELGLDITDPNFKETPSRIARSYVEILSGHVDTEEKIKSILSTKFPSGGYDEMVVVRNINTFSLCPHHGLPVEYIINIAYIPSSDGYVLGLSKIVRIADLLSRRLVLQESLGVDIANAFKIIKPLGVAVLIKGKHMCMRMRGVKARESDLITSYTSGAFRESPATRAEFFAAIKE